MGHAFAPVLVKFTELLARRLGGGVYTTEDAVRYSFFVGLIETLGLNPEDIVLEYDHDKIARAKIDTWIPAFAGRAYAIEFKYDRLIPSQKNQPRTQKAGQIIKDLFRLAQIFSPNAIEAVFIYLTSREMAGYLSNPHNGLADLFELELGASLPIDEGYLSGRANTLQRAAGSVVPCTVDALHSCSLPNEHELRAYGVRRDAENDLGRPSPMGGQIRKIPPKHRLGEFQ